MVVPWLVLAAVSSGGSAVLRIGACDITNHAESGEIEISQGCSIAGYVSTAEMESRLALLEEKMMRVMGSVSVPPAMPDMTPRRPPPPAPPPKAPFALALTDAGVTVGGTIGWTKVAMSDGVGASLSSYGENVVDTAHAYRLPQSQWPEGRYILYYASDTNWRRAMCKSDLRDMAVGSIYECTIVRSDGTSYSTSANFRERWNRYWPISQSQGLNCDLSADAATATFEGSSADCGTLQDAFGVVAIGSPAPPPPLALNTKSALTLHESILWTRVASSDALGSSLTSYGVNVDTAHVYMLPQWQWPAGRYILFYASDSNWKRALCDTDLRDMVVGSTYSCTITRHDGTAYRISATFREKWGRYFPVSMSQGYNCDLSNDAGSAMFESSAADCGELIDQAGIMAIGSD